MFFFLCHKIYNWNYIIIPIRYENVKTLVDVCEYPEGIDISYTQNLIVVACWFEDNIILINLNDLSVKKKIETSGGPRAFGSFIIKK